MLAILCPVSVMRVIAASDVDAFISNSFFVLAYSLASRMPSENLLLIADSEKDADMLYTTGLFVLDLRLAGAAVIWRVMG